MTKTEMIAELRKKEANGQIGQGRYWGDHGRAIPVCVIGHLCVLYGPDTPIYKIGDDWGYSVVKNAEWLNDTQTPLLAIDFLEASMVQS